MRFFSFSVLLFLLPSLVGAQSKVQVCIPVYMAEEAPSQQNFSTPPITEVSGILTMLFDDPIEEDLLLMTRQEDPILWMEKMGVSTRATFIFPENEALYRLELLLSNSRMTINILVDDTKIAWGVIADEKGGRAMRLVGGPGAHAKVLRTIDQVNNYLMRLHLRKQKKIIVRPGFNPDTLNVICGLDTQFDTDFDLLWLNEELYARIEKEAEAAYRILSLTDNLNGEYQEKVENSAIVEHTARLSKSEDGLMYGSLLILFEVMGESPYYFLKGGDRYQIAIDYQFRKNELGRSFLTLETVVFRNEKSGDFMEMNLVDLTPNGIPVLYVDLINSVIMEEQGTWQIGQVFTVLEDIFGIIDLPNER